jgi:hypothetical protein
MPRKSPTRVLMLELGIDADELAGIIGCERHRVRRYVSGDRRIPKGVRNQIIARWGPRAQTFLDAIDLHRGDTELYAPWSNDKGARVGKRVPADAPLISVHIFDDDPDGELFTIDEWRERFGAPGTHVDVHGRQFSTYATED